MLRFIFLRVLLLLGCADDWPVPRFILFLCVLCVPALEELDVVLVELLESV